MLKTLLIIVFIGSFFPSIDSYTQNIDSCFFNKTEAKINAYCRQIQNTKSVNKRISLNDNIVSLLYKTFLDTTSLQYPFDSLKYITTLSPKSRLFRIFNWALPLGMGQYKYFGLIQYYKPSTGFYHVYRLHDRSDTISNPENTICTDSSWFGAIYYDIIETNMYRDTVYTLLGFDFNNRISRKKIIETLLFTNDHNVQFGVPVFHSKTKTARRIVFEYTAKAAMTLQYEPKKHRIVFDHLSPPKPIMKGHHEYYGPDFSYDAFILNNGYWKFKPDVQVTNPKGKNRLKK